MDLQKPIKNLCSFKSMEQKDYLCTTYKLNAFIGHKGQLSTVTISHHLKLQSFLMGFGRLTIFMRVRRYFWMCSLPWNITTEQSTPKRTSMLKISSSYVSLRVRMLLFIFFLTWWGKYSNPAWRPRGEPAKNSQKLFNIIEKGHEESW